jgi:hypothetical protein
MANVIDDFSDIRSDARGTAQQKAKTALRQKNKNEWKAQLEIMGNPDFVADLTNDSRITPNSPSAPQ